MARRELFNQLICGILIFLGFLLYGLAIKMNPIMSALLAYIAYYIYKYND